MEILVHCDDGGDPHCHGTVKIELPLLGLCEVRPNWVKERANGKIREIVKSVRISPENADDWIRQNKNNLSLFDIESIQKKGFFEIGYNELPHAICDPCGSDQSYNEEDENVSARF
jgi:hypothetical protein